MSARLYNLPAPAGSAEPTTLWLGDLRILRRPDGWHVARPLVGGGLVGICSSISLAGALAAARAAQGVRS